jgi:hypothetical protein
VLHGLDIDELLFTGGTPETQRDFLESVSTDLTNNRKPPDRGRKPPIANQFALGYTYQDVLDTDHEGQFPFFQPFVKWANTKQTRWHASRYTSSQTPRPPLPP